MRPLLLLLLVARSASGDPVRFEALAQTPITDGDRVRARQKAFDEALHQALDQALSTLVDPIQAAELKRSLYPRARHFVPAYRILMENEESGLFQLQLEAQVDVASLARELTRPLSVAPQKVRRATVCVTERQELGEWQGSSLEVELVRAIEARGIKAIPLAGRCTNVRGLDDATAAAQARAQGADGALIAAIALHPEPPVRGANLPAASARVLLHLVEAVEGADGRTSAFAQVESVAFGASAFREAARRSLDRSLKSIDAQLAAKWPIAGVGLTVRLAADRHEDYRALIRLLQGLPGVAAVTPRRFAATGADLAVTPSLSAPAIAMGINKSGSHFSAIPVGEDAVEVRALPPALPAPPSPSRDGAPP